MFLIIFVLNLLEIIFVTINNNEFSTSPVKGLVAIISSNLGLRQLLIGGNDLQLGITDVIANYDYDYD